MTIEFQKLYFEKARALIYDVRFLGKAELLQLKLINLFASELLLMKKFEIKKTKPIFIISVLKVE